MIKNEKVYPPYISYCAKVIPLAFNESMSYYECICNITNHINNIIIPAVNESNTLVHENDIIVKENNEIVKEVNEKYVELKDYIDNNMITADTQNLEYYTLTSNLSSVATSGDYDDLLNKPTIPTVPTDISAFNNDSGYITNTVDDLTNYTNSTTLTTLLSGKENITTSGSNANGSYLKFDNGVMIQWGSQELSVNMTNAYGAFYYSLGSSQDFPVDFLDTNYSLNISLDTTGVGGCCHYNKTKSKFYVRCYNGTSFANATPTLHWIAIGKWK